jgi:hypothetical protein
LRAKRSLLTSTTLLLAAVLASAGLVHRHTTCRLRAIITAGTTTSSYPGLHDQGIPLSQTAQADLAAALEHRDSEAARTALKTNLDLIISYEETGLDKIHLRDDFPGPGAPDPSQLRAIAAGTDIAIAHYRAARAELQAL